MSWKRPESVPYPSVWAECDGRHPMAHGRIPHFRIQDPPKEMFDEIINHMNTVFIKEEPLCANANVADEPVSLKELDDLWLGGLRSGTVLVALEVLEDGKTKLAGVNMTLVDYKKKTNLKLEGVAIRKVFDVVVLVNKKADFYEKYGVDFYLTALGLSVAHEYRGQGLGLEILKARFPLCKAIGVPLTSTVFTAANSQEIARRAGFELNAEMEYSSFKINGEEAFPALRGKVCKVMSKRIQ